MKKSRIVSLFALVLLLHELSAQNQGQPWSLNDCIGYALKENIQIKKSNVLKEESRINLKTAKAALFPSLSFAVGQNLTNTPWQDNDNSNYIQGAEGTIYSNETNRKTTYSGNYSLSAQWTLFNGGQRLKGIKQEKLNNQISELNITEQENGIKEQITQVYVQILYADESVGTNENTVALSRKQLERGKELYAAGSIAQADLAQLESQYSSDKYQLVNSQITLRTYKLQLKQLLEIDGSEEMNVAIPQIEDEKVLTPLPTVETVYGTALLNRPEISSGKLDMQNTELSVKIAKAGYMPTISMNAGVSTNHSGGIDNSLSYKLKNGWRNTVGLSLSLPLFNNRQTKSAVEKARLQDYDSKLNFLDDQKTLYKTIESLWLDASGAQEQYRAAGEKLVSAKKSYEQVSQQFALGMKNTVEMLTQMNLLLAAQQELLQAKYMAILNQSLLRFYQGEEISL